LLASWTFLLAGCDPAASEQGTIEISVDPKAVEKDILQPEGIDVPPSVAKKAAKVEFGGGAAEAPAKGKR
jgi:hypothetical protein